MTNLLIVIPACADDAPRAEQLLDWIYQLNGRQPQGHVLLAYAHDVHAEMKTKLRICADLAFEGVSEFQATNRPLPIPEAKPIELKTKVEFVNNLWNQTAKFVAGHYRWPWLYCEPDCVPTNPNWIKTLADAYASQPKKMMGSWMRRKSGASDELFMARTGIYHLGAHAELNRFIGSPPFEWASGPHVIPRCAKTKLIQQLAYDGDFSKVKPEAVLVHGDKGGRLIEHLRNNKVEAIPEHQNGEVGGGR